MQVLQLKIKMIIEWTINKKDSISALVANHLPIYRAIKEFLQTYIQHINDIVIMVQKTMRDMNKNKNQSANITLMQLFDLIRQKELKNIEQWEEKLRTLENKFSGKGTQGKPFPDIFKQIDEDIQYYSHLRTKLKEAIKRGNNAAIMANYKGNEPEQKYNNVFKTYAERVNRERSRTDSYAILYDIQYGNKSPKHIQTKVPLNSQSPTRQAGKIRTNNTYNSIRSKDYSPYKLVNPRFSPRKDDKFYFSQKQTMSQQQSRSSRAISDKCYRSQNEKYENYKNELYAEMNRTFEMKKQDRKPKLIETMYLRQRSPLVKNDKEYQEYSTANSDKYAKQSGKQLKNLQTKQQSTHPKTYYTTGKKYQYLFDQDRDYGQKNYNTQPISRELFTTFGPRKPNQTQNDRFQSTKVPILNIVYNDDSLQVNDMLAKQIQKDMPEVFKERKDQKNENVFNLEQFLVESLMSSNKWDELSQKDSLDEQNNTIFETGKFKQIQYSDQNKNHKKPKIEKIKELPLDKQISTQSRQLNMSFGPH